MSALPRSVAMLVLAVAACALASCSSPESRVESFNRRGEALLEQGDLVKARLEFQNALQINPSTVPALVGLASVAERSHDWRAAYQLLTRVVELQPAHVEALVKLGKLQLASGQLEKAVQTSEAASRVAPSGADVMALQAAVFLKMNEGPKAVATAREALARDPHHIDALVVLASERLQAGDAAAAVTFLDQALHGHERNVSLQMLKVQALEKLGRPEQSEQALRKLVSLFPDKPEYRQLLASFYVAQKQLPKAEAEYRALVAATPRTTGPKLDLVRFVLSVRGPDAAATELEGFARAEPGSHDLKLALADLRLLQKDEPAAIRLWKEVIAGAGDDAAGTRARGAMASYQLAHNDKREAQALIEQMLARDARNEEALSLRAGIAVEERRLDDAVSDLRTILRDAPDSPSANLQLARTHALQGARELAAQHYARAAQTGDFAPAFAMPYARELLAEGRTQHAEGVLLQVLRVSPGHAPALLMLAQAYLRSGDLASAQALADQAGKNAANGFAASQIHGAVQLARRDFGGGVASFRRAYELAPGDPQALAAVVRSYRIAGQPKEALAFLAKVPAGSPQSQLARVLEATLLSETGDAAAALDKFRGAIRLDPRSAFAHQALVAAELATGKPRDALADLDRALQEIPGDFGLRLTRAGVLETQGRIDEAIASYESLLKERPNAMIVANNLAALLADYRRDPASLQRAYEIAQRFRGTEMPQLKDTVGWTMHLVGKHAEAADLLRSASTQAPDLPILQYHYGMNQLALGNVKNAREALGRSLELARGASFAQADAARRTLDGL